MTSEQEMASEEDDSNWTWKDYLQRLEYIDKIIDQIVHSAILLDTNFFAAFGFLQIQGIKLDNGFPVRYASILVSGFGLIINLFLAKSLARQEHIRKWYFSKLQEIPIMPPADITPEKWLHKFGKMKPGYCESWAYILVLVGLVFLCFACLSYCHTESI